jgi:type VI secretion system protein ImpM
VVVPLPDGAVTGAAIFGKLPVHGDFIARGLAPDVRDGLDDWIAASLADARDALGERFENAFDMAPPWRFARPEGDGWVAGAIAPSVDGVGRRYPILAQLGVAGIDSAADAAAHCEAAIYDAFEQGWDADLLHAAVQQTPAAWDDDWPGHAGWWTMGSERLAPATLAGDRPELLIRAMLTLAARDAEGEGAETQTEGAE